MIAEPGTGVNWVSTGAGDDGVEKGTLQVSGTIRGGCLSADRLVHIPGGGDYQVESVSCDMQDGKTTADP
jgi:pre-rRNA-processing protein TSR1